MEVAVLIFEPPGSQFGELRRELRAVAPEPWEVRLVSTSKELLRTVADRSRHYLAILPDRNGDERVSGLGLIEPIRQAGGDVPVVVMADEGNVDLAARAIEAGAIDFLVRGPHLQQRIATLLGKLRRLFEVIDRNQLLDEHNAELREAIQARLKIVGESPQVRRLVARIQRVARVPRPVLITGERGTGKELVARAIHFAAGDATRPIVTVNCAAFTDALLESELFGHEKGAFTGADTSRHGKFEQADGGTLFLDEVGNMSLPFQEKILRVVEYGTFTRVGGTTERQTAARIIAATNRDLRRMIDRGEFLADLYDRLAFETIEVPPLRERQGDVDVLARYFLGQFALETPWLGGKRLAESTLKVLRPYPFPGNVRELKNLIERAAYRDTTDEVTPEDLGPLPNHSPATGGGKFYDRINSLGRHLIRNALKRANGNGAQAARELGLSYHQFRYYLKKYAAE